MELNRECSRKTTVILVYEDGRVNENKLHNCQSEHYDFTTIYNFALLFLLYSK